jgi:hypothetical protein
MHTAGKKRSRTASVKESFATVKKNRSTPFDRKRLAAITSGKNSLKSSKKTSENVEINVVLEQENPREAEDQRFNVSSNDPPIFIFQHVGYTSKNQNERQLAVGSPKKRKLSEKAAAASSKATSNHQTTKKRVVKWIENLYVIPPDFERPARFGPVSGSNYDDRVVNSYMRDKLKRNQTKPDEIVLGFASIDDKISELIDQGFDEQDSRKMLQACSWITSDALSMLLDN